VSNASQQPAVCDCVSAGGVTGNESLMSGGWEGSACLHHGSIIRFGCLQFCFHISEHETLQLITE